jgi:thiamine-phosphate pyrophosphorylase
LPPSAAPPTAVDARCRLYLISPPDVGADFPDLVNGALSGGDVACLQLRLKGHSDEAIIRTAERLLPITRAADVALLINDRPDLAAQAGADGVHIGQSDTSYEEARSLIGSDGIIGVTCHNSRHLAMEAAERGADYVAFGAFFDSPTKPPKYRAEIDLLEWWGSIFEIPCVAIGGITTQNCQPLVQAGADFIAAVSAVWDHPDGPAAAVKAFNDAIAAATA